MHSIIGDVRDSELLRKTFQFFKPDILFHLAAQPLVDYPILMEETLTNIVGLISVLEAAKSCPNLKVIVNVTSDKCMRPQVPFVDNECDRLEEMTLTASKACAELVFHIRHFS